MHKHSFSVPSAPLSAPTSPATTRINRSDRLSVPPVTPQHFPRATKHTLRTPITPASTFSTPYTPVSIRSFASSNGSTLTTPGSATSLKRVPIDVAGNWRSRANENGIKVSDDSHFADDEESDQTISDVNSIGLKPEDALLPPPSFLTYRRVRTQSNAVPFRAPLSPQVTRTPARRTLMSLNTPPQKPTNVSQLKLKGSFTDPAHTRRRPSFGQMSMELFDIDENAYSPYPQSFSSSAQPVGIPLAFQDPFHAPALSAISESTQQRFLDPVMYSGATKVVENACSVCGRSSGPLAVLEPCLHPLCSACLTSALNIVGEKDMECAVCKRPVENFHLQNVSSSPFSEKRMSAMPESTSVASPLQKHSRGERHTLLPSAFELNPFGCLPGQGNIFGQPRDSSTPIPGRLPSTSSCPGENVVLRIDNVPWDITPPAISTWLKQPVERVHVLLDRRGKTLSHAFVELRSEEIAKASLRGAQNSVLGRGKRARGVTVTRSSQEELMRALFPSWKGNFDGSKPSLIGLSNEHVVSTLNGGLITEAELNSLQHLIRSPDSHFLKVPTLPYYSLVSILSKFPADIDSRVFWSSTLRDDLYMLSYTAVQSLFSRIRDKSNTEDVQLTFDLLRAAIACKAFTTQQMNALSDLAEACSLPQSLSDNGSPTTNAPSLHTPDSGTSMSHFRNSSNGQMQNEGVGHFRTGSSSSIRGLGVGSFNSKDINSDPFSAIAREFGVEEQLVQALVQRLENLC